MFPVCSFCGGRPVAVWYEGPAFLVERQRVSDVRSDEAWLACSACAELVRGDQRERLVRISAYRAGRNLASVSEDHIVGARSSRPTVLGGARLRGLIEVAPQASISIGIDAQAIIPTLSLGGPPPDAPKRTSEAMLGDLARRGTVPGRGAVSGGR